MSYCTLSSVEICPNQYQIIAPLNRRRDKVALITDLALASIVLAIALISNTGFFLALGTSVSSSLFLLALGISVCLMDFTCIIVRQIRYSKSQNHTPINLISLYHTRIDDEGNLEGAQTICGRSSAGANYNFRGQLEENVPHPTESNDAIILQLFDTITHPQINGDYHAFLEAANSEYLEEYLKLFLLLENRNTGVKLCFHLLCRLMNEFHHLEEPLSHLYGIVATVVKLLPEVVYEKEDEKTLLTIAARKGYVEICTLLLDSGSEGYNFFLEPESLHALCAFSTSPEFQEKATAFFQKLLSKYPYLVHLEMYGENGPISLVITALLQENINPSLCRLLLSKGANPNAYEPGTRKSLFLLAIEKGESSLFDLLIEKNIYIHFPDISDNSALHYAARYGREEMCRVLIEKGACLCAPNRSHQTPLEMANISDPITGKNCSAIIENAILLPKRLLNEERFMEAANHGNVEECLELFQQGADGVMEPRRCFDILSTLINRQYASEAQRSALLTVCARFLEVNPQTAQERNGSENLLALAAEQKYLDLCLLLIDLGSDTKIFISKRRLLNDLITIPLTAETEEKCTEFFRKLLEKDPGLIRMNFLSEEGCHSLILIAFSQRNINISLCELLLSKGANPNEFDLSTRKNLLMFSIEHGLSSLFHLLIEKGADIHHQDKFKNTALHYAAEKGNREMCQALIRKGINPLQKNIAGQTAAFLASWFRYSECSHIIENAIQNINRRL